MISVKRFADTSGKQFIRVEHRVPDGNVPHATGSCILSCSARGIDDGDARSKAIKFAIATDLLPPFRTFIFTEVDPNLSAVIGRIEGQALPSFSPRSDAHSAVGSSQENAERRVRSFVCKRQNRLPGLGFVVAMARLESGRFRAISFQDHSAGGGGAMSDEVRNKAVRFLRGVAFEKWRKQAVNELSCRDREPAGFRKERALKHVNAFVEIEAGEKVDCACGKNRSRGLMVACERCGAWEHAECQGYRSDKQIPAEYICSACMRAEWEEVVVISLDEQESFGKWRPEDVWTDAKARDRDADVCLVCGCEDNEDFENMIFPESEHVCEGGAALAHPSCIFAAQQAGLKVWNGKVMAAAICHFCGERFAKSPKGNEEVLSHANFGVSQTKSSKGSQSPNHPQSRSSRRAAKMDQTGRAAKRLRSALTNGGVVTKEEVDKRTLKSIKDEESDVVEHEAAEKVGVAPPDRRFSDPAVTVPIKKRRLLMMEVVRSPSPQPSSPSPSPRVDSVSEPEAKPMDQKSEGDMQFKVVQGSEDAEMVEVGSSEQVSADGVPGNLDATSDHRRFSMKEENRREEAVICLSSSNRKLVEGGRGPHAHGSEAVPARQEILFVISDQDNSVGPGMADLIAWSNEDEGKDRGRELSSAVDDEMRAFESEGFDEKPDKSAHAEEGNGIDDPNNKDAGTTTSSASQSRSRDVRLHWDLNMDMEEWERPPEKDTGTFSGLQRESSPPPCSIAPEMTIVSRDLKESPELKSDHASTVHSEPELVVKVVQAKKSEGEVIVEKEKPEAEVEGADTSSSETASVESKHRVEEDMLNSATKESPVEEEYSDVLEAEHVDYDDSDSRNGDDVGFDDADERLESEWRKNDDARAGQANGGQEYVNDVDIKAKRVHEGVGQGEEGVFKLGDSAERASGVEGCEPETTNAVSECAVGMKGIVAQQPDFEHSGEENVVRLEYQEGSDVPPSQEAVEEIYRKKLESVLVREEKRVQEGKEASVPGIPGRRGEGQSRVKSSGWDQLPEGFDKAEDALRAAKKNPAIRSGRVTPWATANGRGTNISSRGGPVSTRFGRGSRVDDIADRARSEDSWNREEHQRTHKVDDSVDVSPRIQSPRGRSHGRGGSHAARSRGRMEPWMDSPTGISSPWVPNRHPSPPGYYSDGFGPRGATSAATRALLKVESSGFVVAPDGTITKAGTSSRGPPRLFQSGGRSGRVGMFNMGRGGGPGMSMGGVGMNLGGSLRMNLGGLGGRGGMSLGPGIGGMNMGLSPGMGIGGIGPGVGLGTQNRGAPGGRGMADWYNGAYSGRGMGRGPDVEHSSASRRGRFHDDNKESWSRREDRSVSPRRRSSSRRSRSGSPSTSKSRTKSPRTRTPPRRTNSSGSAGVSLGKSSKKRSHSPGTHTSDGRGDRDSPPARRAIPPPPKLPLPPPPPRSQRSPPAGLKRLSESKRDGNRSRSRDRDREQRERERERERPIMRTTRSPPKRTSPHVVHGSALMDERDRQLLAVIRHVSPLGARNNRSSEAAGAAGVVTSSRESPSRASPTGRIGEGSGEVRRHSGDEGVEHSRGSHGARREEVRLKADQRGSKETSRTSDRERNARRDAGRDREEERRDGFGRDRDVGKGTYSSSKDRDGRSGSSFKYNREGDDDVAPRRRRPSP